MKRFLLCATALAVATQAHAGGRLDTFNITDESTIQEGSLDAIEVGIFWDERCASVEYTVDTVSTTDENGNAIPIEVVAAQYQASFDRWNEIPTAYIEMNVKETRTIGNGTRSFDFINELTFEVPAGSGFLASSPSTSLQQDTTFSVGDDIDGDGDSDVFDPVAEGINHCTDIDDDGDIEFPAGDYAAGTILDNDVQFNGLLPGQGIPWSTTPLSTDAGGVRSTDIQAVAVHEFGHSHGLSHSFLNQVSADNGRGSTMFPFIDIDDADSERSQRVPWTDDISWTSFIYPEGSALSGIAALQSGDRRFSSVYDVIRGTVTRDGLGVMGGNIIATDRFIGESRFEAFSGSARFRFDPATGGFFFADTLEQAVVDGDYEMPVFRRRFYDLSLQAGDGDPAGSDRVSLVGVTGVNFGQQDFPEEFLGRGRLEGEEEIYPGLSFPRFSSSRRAADFQTNLDTVLRNAGPLDFIGFGALGTLDGVIHAERFDNADVLAVLDAGGSPTTGLFRAFVSDASTVPLFQSASLALGRLNADGTASIESTIQEESIFVAQADDLSPHYYGRPTALSRQLRSALEADPELDVFLVLEVIDGFRAGPSQTQPRLGLANGAADQDTSFLSVGGAPLGPLNALNWVVELRFTPVTTSE